MESNIKGTMNYLAPELLKQIDDDEKHRANPQESSRRGTVKSDVFAEGLVFGYYLGNGVHPYGCLGIDIQANLRKEEPADLSGIG